VLTPTGRYVLIGHDGYGLAAGPLIGSMRKMLPLVLRAPTSPHLELGTTEITKADGLGRFADLMADGRVRVQVERTYGLDHAADALAHLSSGGAEGRLVLVP
jgi:NADPH:quinone reductase-like Zn-dependent oxidoreductase